MTVHPFPRRNVSYDEVYPPRPAIDPAPGRIVLLRHGDTPWSITGQHTGLSDIELTDEGREAALRLGPWLRAWNFVSVVSSPLSRARETAFLAGLASTRVDEDLVEWDYGCYEGRTTKEIREETGTDWQVFTHGVRPGRTPGESVYEVAARASRVLARIEDDLHQGDVALVGHGHALRVLAAVYLRQAPHLGQHLRLDPASVCVLDHHREDPVIALWNHRPDADWTDGQL